MVTVTRNAVKLIACLLLALPALAQEPSPPVEVLITENQPGESQLSAGAEDDVDDGAAGNLADEAPDEPEDHPRLFASAWCPVHRGSPAGDAPGCDGGLAVSLYAWKRLAFVAVVGGDTVGPGLAWVAYRGDDGPVVAVAVGVVARYDGRGVDAGELYPAVGITANLWRRE